MTRSTVPLIPGPKPSHPHFRDLTGLRFGRLSVVGYAGRLGGAHAFGCRCDCGETLAVRGSCLTRSVTRSCGCLLGDRNREVRQTHGMSHKPEWRVWANMKKRCLNPKVRCFKNYGGRGITVCDRWVDGNGRSGGFECFLADMGRRPTPAHTIDRVDNDGPYAPENCRWATLNEQQEHTRRTPAITHNGKTLTPVEWARITGIPREQICRRVGRGWTPARALTQPLRRSA